MKKIMAIGIVGLMGLSVLGGAVAAFGPGYGNGQFQDSAVSAAIDAGDYDAFVAAISEINPLRAEHMTQEQFQQMIANREAHDAVEDAIAAGDYQAWTQAVANTPHGEQMADLVSEDEFDEFILMHDHMEQARELRTQIGLDEIKHGKGMGSHRQMAGKGSAPCQLE